MMKLDDRQKALADFLEKEGWDMGCWVVDALICAAKTFVDDDEKWREVLMDHLEWANAGRPTRAEPAA
jgi:hypothetical protein